MNNVKKDTNIKNAGSGNGMWSGGKSSYYKNHYQLKLNRVAKLKQVNFRCEKCGSKADKLNASRKDGDKNNHDIDNLRMLCSPCQGTKDSKYKRQFGMTLKELSVKYNVPLSTIHNKFISKHKTKASLLKALGAK
jgi:5-methylcytosine-specific restriction endonuclease McrA